MNLGDHILAFVPTVLEDPMVPGVTRTREALEELGRLDPLAISLAQLIALSEGPSSSCSKVCPVERKRARNKIDS